MLDRVFPLCVGGAVLIDDFFSFNFLSFWMFSFNHFANLGCMTKERSSNIRLEMEKSSELNDEWGLNQMWIKQMYVW